jgi:acyl carrier protein
MQISKIGQNSINQNSINFSGTFGDKNFKAEDYPPDSYYWLKTKDIQGPVLLSRINRKPEPGVFLPSAKWYVDSVVFIDKNNTRKEVKVDESDGIYAADELHCDTKKLLLEKLEKENFEKKNIMDKVKEILVETFDIKPEDVLAESDIRNDLGIDSLDELDIWYQLEDEFHIRIPTMDHDEIELDQDVILCQIIKIVDHDKIKTVQDLVDLVYNIRSKQARGEYCHSR